MSSILESDQRKIFELEVSEPIRLDQFLSSFGPKLSRARCIQLIEDGRVSVNGKIIRKKKL